MVKHVHVVIGVMPFRITLWYMPLVYSTGYNLKTIPLNGSIAFPMPWANKEFLEWYSNEFVKWSLLSV